MKAHDQIVPPRVAVARMPADPCTKPDAGFRVFVWLDLIVPWLMLLWLLLRYS